MPLDQKKNEILKKMWELDEKSYHGYLTKEEKEFYNFHLPLIQDYYSTNATYWGSTKPLTIT